MACHQHPWLPHQPQPLQQRAEFLTAASGQQLPDEIFTSKCSERINIEMCGAGSYLKRSLVIVTERKEWD